MSWEHAPLAARIQRTMKITKPPIRRMFSMKNVFIPAAAVALILAAIPSYGQHPAEIGIDGGWTGFDSDVTDSNAWRVGFRAGLYVRDWIEVEGQVAGARAGQTVGS